MLGYIRKSVIDDLEGAASPVRQKNAILRWAQTHGYRVRFYEDMDISGRYEHNRPGWQQLLADLDDPQVAGVIVESFDRDHRNLREFLAFNDDELAPRGQTLFSASQNIDLRTTDGRAMASVLMTFAEMEARKAADRMRDTLRAKRHGQGKYHGPPLFGCDRSADQVLIPSAKTYWLHPASGLASATKPANAADWEQRYYHDALEQLYRIYARGNMSYQATADQLNAAGWRYISGRLPEPQPWNPQHVRNTLYNWPTYGGQLAIGKRHSASRRYIDGAHDPILPTELIQQAGAVFGQRAQKHDNQHTRALYLLSGLTHCAVCGKPLDGGRATGTRRRVYRHRFGLDGCTQPQPDVATIEAGLLAALVEIPHHPEIYAGIVEKVDLMIASIMSSDDHERQAQARLIDLAGKLDRLTDLYVEGDIDQSKYRSRRSVIEAEMATVRQSVTVEMPGNLRTLADQVLAQIGQLANASGATKKAIIRSVIDRLEISDQQISRLIPTPWSAPFFAVLTNVQTAFNPGQPHPTRFKITNWLE